jgi:hypothetical protein
MYIAMLIGLMLIFSITSIVFEQTAKQDSECGDDPGFLRGGSAADLDYCGLRNFRMN